MKRTLFLLAVILAVVLQAMTATAQVTSGGSILVSIVENYQQEDGTIRVPEALVPYVGKEILGHTA